MIAGKLPKDNNVTWRGNSCMQDGKGEPGEFYKDLVGGYYDAGDAIKFNFPMSYAMTLLSWSVIEYSAKYEAAGELNHVKQLIKWGTDYFLKTFNSSADTIYVMVEQVKTESMFLIISLSSVMKTFSFSCVLRLDLGLQVKEVRCIMTIHAGCVLRTLITEGTLLNVTLPARILLQRWRLLWLLPPLCSKTTESIRRSLFTVLRLSISLRTLINGVTGNAVKSLASSISRASFGMSFFGVVRGCITLLEM